MKKTLFIFLVLSYGEFSTAQLCAPIYDMTRNPSSFNLVHSGNATCFWQIQNIPTNKHLYASCSYSIYNNELFFQEDSRTTLNNGGSINLNFYYSTTIGYVRNSASTNGYFSCLMALQPGGKPIIATTQPPTKPVTQPSTCDCGWTKYNRIVGGNVTAVNEFSFMAALVRAKEKTLWCGAVIISQKHVLTVGHCLDGNNVNKATMISNLMVLVGDHNISLGTETSIPPVLLQVQDYVVHPSYVSGQFHDDIAVILVQGLIPVNANVGPACLPYFESTMDITNIPVLMLGWGTIVFSGPTSNALQAVAVPVISNSNCNQQSLQQVLNSMICTWAQGKDACQFDSGGPVIMPDPSTNRFKLVGLISNGGACADQYPAVHTRVSSYIGWIEQMTSQTFCRK